MARAGASTVLGKGGWLAPQRYCPHSDDAINLLRGGRDMALIFAPFHGYFSV
jgi:hypothetical protein